MIVRPIDAIRLTTRMTMRAERESSPEVGSSRNSTEGFAAISTPRVRRLRCSAERFTIVLPRIGVSSTTSATASMTCSFSWNGIDFGRRCSAENRRASRTVMLSMWLSVCSTYPDTRANVLRSWLCPLMRMRPAISPPVLRPAITSISVVLPAPEDPISAMSMPGSKTAFTSVSSFRFSFLPTVTVYSRPDRAIVTAGGCTERF
mmetsp:Transcript_34306/g.81289  ORF Transcript_34306/g.81289 Transcript_34306/m.81289 type:complete len:204 (+) Transcript_34306:178-789(+)